MIIVNNYYKLTLRFWFETRNAKKKLSYSAIFSIFKNVGLSTIQILSVCPDSFMNLKIFILLSFILLNIQIHVNLSKVLIIFCFRIEKGLLCSPVKIWKSFAEKTSDDLVCDGDLSTSFQLISVKYFNS